MIRTLVVDDHSMVRSGLIKILKEESDIEVLAEADGYPQLLNCLKTVFPDIILMDISMPGKNGLEIVKELKQTNPEIKTLVLSMHPEERFSVRAIKAGALGYVSKESAADELVRAIRQVYNGGKYITPIVAEQLANSYELESNKLPHERLSDREFQILRMIASGKKIKEIASELSISPATVATYRARVLEKLQLKSNVEITSYALRNNLVE
ncbi:MAG TPA: response regulator transcription factor [Cyclobacteriaceae bacterium]|jgi:DNA-binding NarL/FixJ family response regulator|nr:response regulator transcription factor [Cyclobacteriaceae bacterium]